MPKRFSSDGKPEAMGLLAALLFIVFAYWMFPFVAVKLQRLPGIYGPTDPLLYIMYMTYGASAIGFAAILALRTIIFFEEKPG